MSLGAVACLTLTTPTIHSSTNSGDFREGNGGEGGRREGEGGKGDGGGKRGERRQYKLVCNHCSWSPRGVFLAAKNAVKFIKDNKVSRNFPSDPQY